MNSWEGVTYEFEPAVRAGNLIGELGDYALPRLITSSKCVTERKKHSPALIEPQLDLNCTATVGAIWPERFTV